MPDTQVTSLLPKLKYPGSEQVSSTTVPGSTGNCVAVSSLPVQSVSNPMQSGDGVLCVQYLDLPCSQYLLVLYKYLLVFYKIIVYTDFSQNQKGFGCIVAAVISLSFLFLNHTVFFNEMI